MQEAQVTEGFTYVTEGLEHDSSEEVTKIFTRGMTQPDFCFRWIILATLWTMKTRKTAGGYQDQHRINLATNPLILAVEAVIEESMQQKIGLVKQEATQEAYTDNKKLTKTGSECSQICRVL